MESKVVIQGIEWVASGLEFLGVALIGLAFLYATIRALLHVRDLRPEAYQRIKINIGKALQMGLEFLVAADITCGDFARSRSEEPHRSVRCSRAATLSQGFDVRRELPLRNALPVQKVQRRSRSETCGTQ
jgi:Protein of unknown function (DUF1622)